MLTDVDDFGIGRTEYFYQAYSENKTISRLADEGYLVSVFTDTYYGYDPATELPSYISNRSRVQFTGLDKPYECAIWIMLMQLYRTFPVPLKGLIRVSSNIVNVFSQFEVLDNANEKVYSTDMLSVHNYIDERGFSFTDQNVFALIHLDGCHHVYYDDQWQKTSSNDTTYSIKTSFAIIDSYIAALKQVGAYEDATIIIAGDHGIPYSNVRERWQPSLTALFVKPVGASSGPLDISNKQTSHSNIWPTIFQSAGIYAEGLSKSIFQIAEGENTNRLYIWNIAFGQWTQSFWEINGTGSDWANWNLQQVKEYNKNMFD